MLRRESHAPRERDPARLEGVDRVVVACALAAIALGVVALVLAWGTL